MIGSNDDGDGELGERLYSILYCSRGDGATMSGAKCVCMQGQKEKAPPNVRGL